MRVSTPRPHSPLSSLHPHSLLSLSSPHPSSRLRARALDAATAAVTAVTLDALLEGGAAGPDGAYASSLPTLLTIPVTDLAALKRARAVACADLASATAEAARLQAALEARAVGVDEVVRAVEGAAADAEALRAAVAAAEERGERQRRGRRERVGVGVAAGCAPSTCCCLLSLSLSLTVPLSPPTLLTVADHERRVKAMLTSQAAVNCRREGNGGRRG